MDPVTIVATAVAVGAAAGVTDTAKQSVSDAYAALKRLLGSRFRGVDVGAVEDAPESADAREALADELAAQGAGADTELLAAAEALIGLARVQAAEVVAVVGVDLSQFEANSLRIADVASSGSGVRVRDAQLAGDIDISNVRAGQGESPHPQ
ncbi:hypothetical protein F3087_08380 [Nocardia colli]|uniref:RHIM domain-containing protein n=1 Tax=Nocardia colli TaxID=2545717 RepID=A0A5N0ENJ1_9NOCA|nr:hypothetical protein [Nocardia colli]KAA8889001.1 hypothetical protein F3087_08380 [Nocardia colli]